MIKIYIKKTPVSEWQYIGTVATPEQANRVGKKATLNGYYWKMAEA